MDRRTASIALLAAPLAGLARAQAGWSARVAWISLETRNPDSPYLVAFQRQLREAGWVDGRNLTLDAWWSGGSGPELERTIERALARRPDIVVAAGGLVVRPLLSVKPSVPIVFVYSGDAVLGGVVQSYARPGVDRTGVSLFSLELVPKRLALLKETLPSLRRVALVGWPHHAGEPNERAAAIDMAEKLGLEHAFHAVSGGADIEAAFERMLRERTEAFLVFADGVTISFAERFAAFTRSNRIPSIAGWAQFAERGNLMTYGPVISDCFGRVALMVDRILKGTRAADIPVELPSTQELVVNRRTATHIGLEIPAAILARADRFID